MHGRVPIRLVRAYTHHHHSKRLKLGATKSKIFHIKKNANTLKVSAFQILINTMCKQDKPP